MITLDLSDHKSITSQYLCQIRKQFRKIYIQPGMRNEGDKKPDSGYTALHQPPDLLAPAVTAAAGAPGGRQPPRSCELRSSFYPGSSFRPEAVTSQ